jgi:hypothetical protein
MLTKARYSETNLDTPSALSQVTNEEILDTKYRVADLQENQKGMFYRVSYGCHTDSHSDQELRNVVDWLSPFNFEASQSKFFLKGQDGTGRWLIDSKEFMDWRDGTSQTLFCPGIRETSSINDAQFFLLTDYLTAGSGKTILA